MKSSVMNQPATTPLPFSLLSGFLGSGKTTLLNRLLHKPELARAAVIVNELGEIGLDHLLVRHVDEELVLLESGCVCCTLRGDLVAQLEDLLSRRDAGEIPAFDRVVLETTGLAEAAPIVQTLISHPVLSERLYVDGVIVTVDAQHGAETLRKYAESRKQLAVADRVVITKSDLVSEEQVREVERLVRQVQPTAEMRRSEKGEVETRFVVGVGHLDMRAVQVQVHAHAHEHGHTHEHEHGHTQVKSVSVTLEKRVDFRAFSLWVAMLTQLNGERILRLKAIVSARGEPTPVAVQAVQHVVYPPLTLPSVPGLGDKSHVVVLTHGMDEQELDDLRTGLLELAR